MQPQSEAPIEQGQAGEARRALILVDRPLVVSLIELTLNHGLFVVHGAARLGVSTVLHQSLTPVLGLTRRGDLRTKLRAFDLGVDDILTVPFSPEELLARSIVISRRSSGIARVIVPTIRLGEMEIDIVQREVRAGASVIP
jgi:DNA-binding response OmpR family regulator